MGGSGSGSKGGGAGTKAPKSSGGGGGLATPVSPSNPAPATPTGVIRALEASPGAVGDNFVKLSDLRDRMGGTRAEQDAAIRQAVNERLVSLNSHEGMAGRQSPEMKAAAIHQSPDRDGPFTGRDGRKYATEFIYISKRN
jgi:hypothetical protein